MSNNIQAKFTKLRALSYEGTQEDMEITFYQDRGATSNSLRDAEQQFLANLGYTSGTVADKWMNYLRAEGYTGTLDDMWPLFWADQAGV